MNGRRDGAAAPSTPATVSRPVVARHSRGKMLRLGAGALVLFLLSLVLALRLLPGDEGYAPLGYGGAIFFGLCLVGWIWRFLTMKGPVVTIDARGIRDIRLAREVIPWAAVRGIKTWEYSRQKAMVLDVDPAVEPGLGLTRTARWTRGMNAAVGASGLSVTPHGLTVDYDTLLSTSLGFWNGSGGVGTDRPASAQG